MTALLDQQAATPSTMPRAAAGRMPAPLRATRPALQWRLILLWVGTLLLPTLAAALPFWTMLGAALDRSVQAAALAQRLDLATITDLIAMHTRYGAAITSGGIVALVLTLLLSPLLTGAAITAARAPQTPGFAALVAGGVLEYGRLARMLLWALLPLGLVGVAAGAGFDLAGEQGKAAILPGDASLPLTLAQLVVALLFLGVHATLDLGRAVLALDRRRTSAVRAWFAGLRVLARRPFAVAGAYLGLTALGLALVALLAVARINTPPLGVAGFIGALLLTQLAVAALAWMRCARLFGLMEVARSVSKAAGKT
ncbi:hypothetical protein [Massilia sp. DD77]|uniref:hypothetical protein n=1 Tax=Massilia sp. DD77 TaxID=3109349 RepID=UPI002FFF9E9D